MTLLSNQIYLGDCLDLMRHIEDETINLVIADLPYGQTENKWDTIISLEPLWDEYLRITIPGTPFILFSQGMFTAELMMSQKSIWRYNYIWDKGSCTGFLNARKMPLREHEDICVFYEKLPQYNPQFKSGPKTHQRGSLKSESKTYGYHDLVPTDPSLGHAKYPTSILKFSIVPHSELIHPSQKPLPLIEYLIKTYSNDGDLILDNCMGSGTTAEACIRTGRQFIGFEKEKVYFDKAQERIKKSQEQGKISGWF